MGAGAVTPQRELERVRCLGDLPDAESPYLQSKALLLMAGVPAQEARLSTITQSTTT